MFYCCSERYVIYNLHDLTYHNNSHLFIRKTQRVGATRIYNTKEAREPYDCSGVVKRTSRRKRRKVSVLYKGSVRTAL